MEIYLKRTPVMDWDHPDVAAFTENAVGGVSDPSEKAIRLFRAVRDEIRYDPYAPFYREEHYRASATIRRGRSFCIPKAVLLCAAARREGIPARLGFATVRNHLATPQLLAYLGTDVFVFHGYTELFLNDRWIKVTPTFNRELCTRHGVPPLEFDGRNDALFHPYNLEKKKYMEYITYHGTFPDVPLDRILEAWKATYGEGRVNGWIDALEKEKAES